ncbi:MAG: DUF3450 family protein [Verrucomicrobia bacterium]|nr:DUF3450 family protein [Verrucomicrobiota bacterium]
MINVSVTGMGWRGWFCGLALMSFVVVRPAGGGELDTLEGLVKQWADLRTEIATEPRHWSAEQQQWARERIVLERELVGLDAELATAESVDQTHEREQAEALTRRAEITESHEALKPLLDRAEAALRAWPPRIPAALAVDLQDDFAQLPASDHDAARRGVGERLQRIIALYTSIESIENDVHLVREILPIPAGTRREMDVLYVGLARAFAVSHDDQWAAVGSPGEPDWIWVVRPAMGPAVRRAVDIINRERTAELVRLPLRVSNGVPAP